MLWVSVYLPMGIWLAALSVAGGRVPGPSAARSGFGLVNSSLVDALAESEAITAAPMSRSAPHWIVDQVESAAIAAECDPLTRFTRSSTASCRPAVAIPRLANNSGSSVGTMPGSRPWMRAGGPLERETAPDDGFEHRLRAPARVQGTTERDGGQHPETRADHPEGDAEHVPDLKPVRRLPDSVVHPSPAINPRERIVAPEGLLDLFHGVQSEHLHAGLRVKRSEQRRKFFRLEALEACIALGSIAGAAHELDIAESTARQHLSGLHRRTGCTNAVQAGYWLGRVGSDRRIPGHFRPFASGTCEPVVPPSVVGSGSRAAMDAPSRVGVPVTRPIRSAWLPLPVGRRPWRIDRCAGRGPVSQPFRFA